MKFLVAGGAGFVGSNLCEQLLIMGHQVTAVDNSASAITQTADVKFYVNFSTLGVVAVVISAPDSDPRDSLVPPKPQPTPLPTVTITAIPSPSPSPSSNG